MAGDVARSGRLLCGQLGLDWVAFGAKFGWSMERALLGCRALSTSNLTQMDLPDLRIAIWRLPHRGHGFFIEVDAELVADELPGGTFQSSADLAPRQSSREFHPDQPHQEFRVYEHEITSLAELADGITYSFREQPHTPRLGGSRHGLLIERGYQVATIEWYGPFDDQDELIRKLFEEVEALASKVLAP